MFHRTRIELWCWYCSPEVTELTIPPTSTVITIPDYNQSIYRLTGFSNQHLSSTRVRTGRAIIFLGSVKFSEFSTFIIYIGFNKRIRQWSLK